MDYTIVIDPGHGGFDAGASYQNRKEKDDNLRLAMAVGQMLENAGYRIIYTRTTDQYDSPYEKAQIANNAGGDVFISFHRNYAERDNLYNGVQALVYSDNPTAVRLAEDINAQLEAVGYDNLGIEQRRELVVLRRTRMPAVLLEVGFINSTKDNQLFDDRFNETAEAIARGVMEAIPIHSTSTTEENNNTENNRNNTRPMPNQQMPNQQMPNQQMPNQQMPNQQMPNQQMPNQQMPNQQMPNQQMPNEQMPSQQMPSQPTQDRQVVIQPIIGRPSIPNQPNLMPPSQQMPNQQTPSRPTPSRPIEGLPINMQYYVQVGLFRYPENAVYLMEQLKQQGYDTVWKRVGGLIAIWVGPVATLDEAVRLQRQLQNAGYETLVVTEEMRR